MDHQEAIIQFEQFVQRKKQRAATADIPGFESSEDNAMTDPSLEAVLGNNWTHKLFDGVFYRSRARSDDFPLLSAVFVRSKNGNTDTESGNPGDLGGGETDLHLIYEGMSRVDADGVMAGANTIRGSNMVFGVWHSELIKLRQQLKPDRPYPAQIIVTASGRIDIENELMFNLPDIPVYVITTDEGMWRINSSSKLGPWAVTITTGATLDLSRAALGLKSLGIDKISVVGGRTTVSELFDQGLISDLYLTTSAIDGGKPNTPFYVGKNKNGLPRSRLVLKKIGKGPESGVVFEHLAYT